MTLDAPVFAALASPRRREILRLVWEDELAAGRIHAAMGDVTFGAVSLHLRSLERAGLVDVRVASRHRFYRARRAALGEVGAMLEEMWASALWRLRIHAELEESRRGPRPRRAHGASASPSHQARSRHPRLRRSDPNPRRRR